MYNARQKGPFSLCFSDLLPRSFSILSLLTLPTRLTIPTIETIKTIRTIKTMKTRMLRLLLPLAVALLAAAPFARADFSSYCDLTIAGYDADRSALANFPVLVRISETGINGFSYSTMQSDGKDLAFTSTDGATTYPHEIDTWDTTGESLVWVLLPSMANGTTFRMNWGDPSITAAPAYTTSGQMWVDAGYVGVWHLGEAANAPFSRDSTANRLHATNNAVAAASVGGVVGSGRNPASTGKNGKDGMLVEGWTDWQDDHFTDTLTATAWVRHSGGNLNYDHVFSTKTNYADKNGGWSVLTAHAAGSGWYTYGSGSGKTQVQTNILTGASAEWQHLAVTFNGGIRQLYLDGVSIQRNSGQARATATTNALALGSTPLETSSGNHWRGDLDEMRVSSVARSDDWVYAECRTAIDPAFLTHGNAISDAALLTVVGDPDNYGTAAPAYGSTTDVTAGGSLPASVSATNLLESGFERWVCTGYTHYEILDAATGAKTMVQQGNTAAFAYVHVGQDELVWHFTNEWLVAALATAGGSVSTAAETWVRNGETVSLVATPDAGYDFWRWDGDTDGIADVSAASISPTITAARTLRAVFAPAGADVSVQYVATTGDDAYDGYSAESPKLTIQAAVDTLAAMPGYGTVHVAPGLYQTSSSESVAITDAVKANVAVTNAIAIIGDTGKPEDVIVRNTSTFNQAQVIVFYLDHPGALVANMTAEDGHRSAPTTPFGSNVSINTAGGTVSNCVLRGAITYGNYTRGTGAWLNSDAALLTHCVVTNNGASGSGYQITIGGGKGLYGGLFVHVDKGTVANCLIANNRDTSGWSIGGQDKQSWSSSVTIRDGSLLNCTVVTNEARYTGGVYLHPDGYAKNVVVAGCVNRCSYTNSLGQIGWSDIGFKGTLANASHCASDGGEALDATCVAGTMETFFRDVAARDYRPRMDSPLVDKGVAYGGIASLDLLGKTRAQGAPDIGCYENSARCTLILVK